MNTKLYKILDDFVNSELSINKYIEKIKDKVIIATYTDSEKLQSEERADNLEKYGFSNLSNRNLSDNSLSWINQLSHDKYCSLSEPQSYCTNLVYLEISALIDESLKSISDSDLLKQNKRSKNNYNDLINDLYDLSEQYILCSIYDLNFKHNYYFDRVSESIPKKTSSVVKNYLHENVERFIRSLLQGYEKTNLSLPSKLSIHKFCIENSISKEEKVLIDQVAYIKTKIHDIEEVRVHNILSYLHVIRSLKKSGLDKKHFKVRQFEFNPLFNSIFKIAESSIRNKLKISRINIDQHAEPLVDLIGFNGLDFVSRIVDNYQIGDLSLDTRIKLNKYNSGRWKRLYNEIANNQNVNQIDFKYSLIHENFNNSSLPDLLYRISKDSTEHSLALCAYSYVYHIHYSEICQSNKKNMPKKLQKYLSRNNMESHFYEVIVKNIPNSIATSVNDAIDIGNSMLSIPRKKISLDQEKIHDVKGKDISMTEKLNAILEEDLVKEDENYPVNNSEETDFNRMETVIIKEITNSTKKEVDKNFIIELCDQHNQIAILVIEEINNKFYEENEVKLIEENDTSYFINEALISLI